MFSPPIDPHIDDIVQVLDENPLAHLPAALSGLYVAAGERKELSSKMKRVGVGAIKAVSTLAEPAGAAIETLTALLEDEPSRFREQLCYFSISAGLLDLQRACEPEIPPALKKIVLLSAVTEFERARGLLDGAGSRDAFIVDLLESWALSRIPEAASEARYYAARCLDLLRHSSIQISAATRDLERKAGEAERSLQRVRSRFTEEQINESGARFELGIIKPTDTVRSRNEPMVLIAHGQAMASEARAEAAEAQRYEQRYTRVIGKLSVEFAGAQPGAAGSDCT